MRNRPPENRAELVALLQQLQHELDANQCEITVNLAQDPRLELLAELREATIMVRTKLCKLGGTSSPIHTQRQTLGRKTMPQTLARNAALSLVNIVHRCRPFIKARSSLVLELPSVLLLLTEPYENEEPDPVRDEIELIAIRSAGGLINSCLLHQNRGAVLQMLVALGCPMQGLISRWGEAAGLVRVFRHPELAITLNRRQEVVTLDNSSTETQPIASPEAAPPVNDSAPPQSTMRFNWRLL